MIAVSGRCVQPLVCAPKPDGQSMRALLSKNKPEKRTLKLESAKSEGLPAQLREITTKAFSGTPERHRTRIMAYALRGPLALKGARDSLFWTAPPAPFHDWLDTWKSRDPDLRGTFLEIEQRLKQRSTESHFPRPEHTHSDGEPGSADEGGDKSYQ